MFLDIKIPNHPEVTLTMTWPDNTDTTHLQLIEQNIPYLQANFSVCRDVILKQNISYLQANLYVCRDVTLEQNNPSSPQVGLTPIFPPIQNTTENANSSNSTKSQIHLNYVWQKSKKLSSFLWKFTLSYVWKVKNCYKKINQV